MKERWTVVTRKGQVTVPAPIRREMGLEKGDKVAFVVEDGAGAADPYSQRGPTDRRSLEEPPLSADGGATAGAKSQSRPSPAKPTKGRGDRWRCRSSIRTYSCATSWTTRSNLLVDCFSGPRRERRGQGADG